MPANRLSLSLTEAYRERCLTLRDSVQALTRATWRTVTMDDLEGSFDQWRTLVATGVAGAQQEVLRATRGYLAAFVTTELGESAQAPPLDSRDYVGKTRDGRDVREALDTAPIGVRVALKRGVGLEPAMRAGLNRALRMVEGSVMHAARSSLNELMEASEDVEGWQRAVRGTCGACMGDIEVEVYTELPGVPLNVHPYCMCMTQPVVVGVPDRFPLATGQQRLAQMTPQEQDRELGPRVAEAVRSGDVALGALVGTSPQKRGEDFITQAPGSTS